MSKRNVNLLSQSELNDLYEIPEFNKIEQALYFSLTYEEIKLISQFTTIQTKIYFILQLGYFKAKHLFFKFQFEDVPTGVAFVFDEHFKNCRPFTLKGSISRERIEIQKQVILNHLDYKVCTEHHLSDAKKQLEMLIKSHPKPHNAVRELLKYFADNNLILPAYRKLQDMYSEAYKNELIRLSLILNKIPDEIKDQLHTLINDNEVILSLNDLRYDQKNFNYGEIVSEVAKVNELTTLYHSCKSMLSAFKLSQNAIRYYSEIVEQYPSSKLRKMSRVQQYLHAVCFIYHRYQIFVDNLITSFIHHIKIIKKEAKAHADKEFFSHATKIIKKYPNLATFFRWFPQQQAHETSSHSYYEDAYRILPKDDFEKFANYFEGSDFNITAAKWQHYEKLSRTVSLYLRPIILAIDLKHYKADAPIMPLLNLLKKHFSSGKTPAQLKLPAAIMSSLPVSIVPYLKSDPNDEDISPYRFEFYVYSKIFHHVDRGRMFCNDSVSSKDIDCDLVADEMVDKADEIATKFGYQKIPIYCDERLDDLLTELDEAWEVVTNNIKTGTNTGIKVEISDNGTTTWQLNYDAGSKLDDSFFRNVNKLDIANMFTFIDSKTNAFDEFEHIKGRYVKRTKPTALAIKACILSEAFGFGVKKMAEMSDIDHNTLRTTHEDFIRVETLSKVNDCIASFIKELPIFKAWNLLDDKLLADIDGQKAETTSDTIQSRYSKKHLGKGKGLSILSLIANFVAANVKNIGLNEYEGHHLYDMVYGNKSGVQIDAVTGDNHSVNQLNFVALDMIDIEFIPSIKKIKAEAEKLYSVKDPKEFEGIIKPIGTINVDRIKKHKRGIIRVLLSLILQESTQSIIIRKLNSHDRYAGLRAALYEYNKIFKSIHILKMIDDMELRKAIRTARNRTEAYHQLQKLIRNMFNGIFKGKRISNHSVSTQAVRLISNSVIAYNAIILNTLYERMLTSNASEKEIEKFLKISPMAWIHISFTGRYTFKNGKFEIDLASIMKILEKELKSIGIKCVG
ncbi:MAG: Tn3 family transposase [Alteromonadaceae bacterium]|nr:Tn3 family transposase [Alteromonadaceae bacterium]